MTKVRACQFGILLREMCDSVAIAEVAYIPISNLNQSQTLFVFFLVYIVQSEVEQGSVVGGLLPHSSKQFSTFCQPHLQAEILLKGNRLLSYHIFPRIIVWLNRTCHYRFLGWYVVEIVVIGFALLKSKVAVCVVLVAVYEEELGVENLEIFA